jgi:hypothetical protein
MPTFKNRITRRRRVPVKLKGELSYELTYGEQRRKCLIQDINELGMFLICNDELEVGQVVTVRFELEQGLPFEAKLKVKFHDNGCIGTQIVEADATSSWNLQQYLKHNVPNPNANVRWLRAS